MALTRIGLQIPRFTYEGVADRDLFERVAAIATTAEDAGFDSIWVMDHFFQIRGVGRPEEPMLEGWTTLGWMAANTQRARLGLMVGGVHYRQPGLWVKAATTLDVLSGGRAWLGIGAAWNQEESEGLGFAFPPLAERFELLEDALRFAHEMWKGERGTEAPFEGHRVAARRLLNSPQALTRPHPPIMVGGGGERKTLRLVAQYADATNVFGSPEGIAHKYRVLREHCEAIGRPYDEIERSTLQTIDPAKDGHGGTETPARIVDRFGELADAGAQHVIFSLRGERGVWDTSRLELVGRDIIPAVRSL